MTPKRKQINILDGTCSKSDELDWLRKVQIAAGKGSYMSSLFTDKLIDWANWGMRNDLTLDIHSELMGAIDKNSELIDEKNSRISELENEKKELLKEAGEVTRELNNITESYSRALDTIAYKSEIIDTMIKNEFELKSERGKLKHELALADERHAREMAEKASEIQALKARLYDLLIERESEDE